MLQFLIKKILTFSTCIFFPILVIKTLDLNLDPPPDPQLPKILDQDQQHSFFILYS
jgi:hypothetical protein